MDPELVKTIRAINADASLSLDEKTRRIQAEMAKRRAAAAPSAEAAAAAAAAAAERASSTPQYASAGVLGCAHYQRGCRIVAKCCGRMYVCRVCHDDAEDHAIDRFATEQMQCMHCFAVQPVAACCAQAACPSAGAPLARYYCPICRLWEDAPGRDIFHCTAGCGMCRVGKGLGIDVEHCPLCNLCYTKSSAVHQCPPERVNERCPMCLEQMRSSRTPTVITNCGHQMHQACYMRCLDYSNIGCPICRKSLLRWTPQLLRYYRSNLAVNPMPDEYSGYTAEILCNDCEHHSVVPYHFVWMQCPQRPCVSFNTSIVKVIVGPPLPEGQRPPVLVSDGELSSSSESSDGEQLPEDRSVSEDEE
jgi:zinc finger-like protein